MYQTKQMIYKSLFVHEDQKETLEYKQSGIVFEKDGYQCLSFQTNDYVIEMNYNDTNIVLKHGTSLLRLSTLKEVYNDYETIAGIVKLRTKILSFEANEDVFKIRYELYDDGGLISTVYILVKMLPL